MRAMNDAVAWHIDKSIVNHAATRSDRRQQPLQIFQRPDHILMIYRQGPELRHARMNEPHPTQVTPSWYGDSVGHYEGDTLVLDTVGIKRGPFAMVDIYGTPHSATLHVVERYRLVDNDDAKDAMERNAKENSYIAATAAAGVNSAVPQADKPDF